MFRQTHSYPEPWETYLAAIQRGHCPYIARSMRHQVLTVSEYSLVGIAKPEDYAFALGVVHTEILLNARSSLGSGNGKLMCENISFGGLDLSPPNQEHFFQWLHWALKLRYTDLGVVFGKFWPTEVFVGQNGRPVPPPPQLLLSIRSTIGERDAIFFNVSPALADRHKTFLNTTKAHRSEIDSRTIERFRALIHKDGVDAIQREQVEAFASQIAMENQLMITISKDAFLSMAPAPK